MESAVKLLPEGCEVLGVFRKAEPKPEPEPVPVIQLPDGLAPLTPHKLTHPSVQVAFLVDVFDPEKMVFVALASAFPWCDCPGHDWAAKSGRDQLTPYDWRRLKQLIEGFGIQEDMDINLAALRAASEGERDKINPAMTWEFTPQGAEYWRAQWEESQKDIDTEALKGFLRQVEFAGPKPDDWDDTVVPDDVGDITADQLSNAFLWDKAIRNGVLWSQEYNRLNDGEGLSPQAWLILHTWKLM
jgi:hypothetical protein